MGEIGDFGQNEQASENLSTTRSVPRITAETPKNGLTMGENVETGDFRKKWVSVRKLVRSVPRVTMETPEMAYRWGKMWKRATSGKNGQALENAPRQVRYPCYNGNP
jgi:hypothetical protein